MIYQEKFSDKEIESLQWLKAKCDWSEDTLDNFIGIIGFESNFNPNYCLIDRAMHVHGYIRSTKNVSLKVFKMTGKKLRMLPPEEQIKQFYKLFKGYRLKNLTLMDLYTLTLGFPLGKLPSNLFATKLGIHDKFKGKLVINPKDVEREINKIIILGKMKNVKSRRTNKDCS